MTDLDRYLQAHYLNAEQFAAHCAISLERLNALIDAGRAPQPSYVVTPTGKLTSFVFGEMDAPGAIPGAYFHAKSRSWIERALSDADTAALEARFGEGYARALAALNQSVWRMPDSFTDAGEAIPAGLALRVQTIWKYFLNGTCCLCVADPSSEASIARKEVLQEKLTALSDGGADASCARIERAQLEELIEQYAQAAMPFSPIEYPRSSAKRLIEDLRKKLAGAG